MDTKYYIKEFTYTNKGIQSTNTYAKTTRSKAETHLGKISKKLKDSPDDSDIHFKQYRMYRITGKKDKFVALVTGDKYREEVTKLFKQIQNGQSNSNKSN